MADNRVKESLFSLIIEGDSLQTEEIESALGLKATRIIRKGEVLNRLPMISAQADEWTYTVVLDSPEGVDTQLNLTLAQLILHQTELKQLAERCKVMLRLYVQSDYAQMSYMLMPETLQRLVAVGLPLYVSSVSWGEVRL